MTLIKYLNYNCFHLPRGNNRRGSGVSIIYKSNYIIQNYNSLKLCDSEYLLIYLNISSIKINLIIIYHPRSNND